MISILNTYYYGIQYNWFLTIFAEFEFRIKNKNKQYKPSFEECQKFVLNFYVGIHKIVLGF